EHLNNLLHIYLSGSCGPEGPTENQKLILMARMRNDLYKMMKDMLGDDMELNAMVLRNYKHFMEAGKKLHMDMIAEQVETYFQGKKIEQAQSAVQYAADPGWEDYNA
ncbi:MAG: hypothetical protein K2F99_07095, partial [Muribaculaceae bacterium]|nr:hypothetical protein [Muribaculaceae bacterium]